MVQEWGARITDGWEADDQLGIESQKETNDTYIICSIDKDLLQVPAQHYNFVRRTLDLVDEGLGWRNFYTQLLIGDATDNVRGCPSIGKAKAPRILEQAANQYGLYTACRDTYESCYNKLKLPNWEDDLHLNANLLYVLRREDDKWTPPLVKYEPEQVVT